MWSILDEHYCFFAEKQVDWNEVHARYSQRISPSMTREELFAVCSEMLAELKDGHTNLSAAFATSYYRNGGAIIHRITMRGSLSNIISISTIDSSELTLTISFHRT